MAKMTCTLDKIRPFAFLKIESDFDLLFSFSGYKGLKTGPIGPETVPALDSNPIILRTSIFLDMRFSLQGTEGSDLTSHQKSRKSLEPLLRKIENTSISATFCHFFQNRAI